MSNQSNSCFFQERGIQQRARRGIQQRARRGIQQRARSWRCVVLAGDPAAGVGSVQEHSHPHNGVPAVIPATFQSPRRISTRLQSRLAILTDEVRGTGTPLNVEQLAIQQLATSETATRSTPLARALFPVQGPGFFRRACRRTATGFRPSPDIWHGCPKLHLFPAPRKPRVLHGFRARRPELKR